MPSLLPVLAALALGAANPPPRVERQVVASISIEDVKGGVLSELAWDGETLLLQGVSLGPKGDLVASYFIVPSAGVRLTRIPSPPPAAIAYWTRKANRVSPTGVGTIVGAEDAAMPILGIGGFEQRIADATNLGGITHRFTLRLGPLVLHERTTGEPYDGELWSWSPPELNRIAYVDGKGDLWVAGADGANAQRLVRGDFTLPAWSDDGRTIAVADRKNGGRRWEISLVYLPESLRTPPR